MELPTAGEISIEINKKQYRARHKVDNRVLTVLAGDKTRSGEILEGFPPDTLARMILAEMVADGEV